MHKIINLIAVSSFLVPAFADDLPMVADCERPIYSLNQYETDKDLLLELDVKAYKECLLNVAYNHEQSESGNSSEIAKAEQAINSADSDLQSVFLEFGENQRARFQSPLGFKLERATLSDIQSALGATGEFEIPGSHHQFGVCYTVRDSSEIVVFATGREFGGPTKRLLGVTLHAQNSESFPCSESVLSSSDIDFGGLNLQISPQEFAALAAGEPEPLEGGYVDHDLQYVRALTDDERKTFVRRSIDPDLIEGAYVGLGIWARFDDELAVEVGVWQITRF